MVAGYKIISSETTTDLAVLAAIVSSALDVPVPRRTLVVGEVDLKGSLKAVKDLEVCAGVFYIKCRVSKHSNTRHH